MNIHMGSIKDNVDQFLNLYWICYNTACCMFAFFFFFFCYEAYLSCPTRDRTCTPCIGRWNLNHWTTREVPNFYLFLITTFINLKSVFKTHKWMWRSTHIKFALHLLSFKVSFVTKLSCSPSISQKLHKSLQSKLWITTFLNWTYNVYHLWARILFGRMCRKAVIWNMSHNQEMNDLLPESWLQNTTFSFGS